MPTPHHRDQCCRIGLTRPSSQQFQNLGVAGDFARRIEVFFNFAQRPVKPEHGRQGDTDPEDGADLGRPGDRLPRG